MQQTVIFKVAEIGKTWEETPIKKTAAFYGSRKERINQVAQTMADNEGREVRWNYDGSLQGHYFQPR